MKMIKKAQIRCSGASLKKAVRLAEDRIFMLVDSLVSSVSIVLAEATILKSIINKSSLSNQFFSSVRIPILLGEGRSVLRILMLN